MAVRLVSAWGCVSRLKRISDTTALNRNQKRKSSNKVTGQASICLVHQQKGVYTVMESLKATETTALMDNNTIEENETPVIRKKIGNITFLVRVQFNGTGKETMQDKICRMLREEVKYTDNGR